VRRRTTPRPSRRPAENANRLYVVFLYIVRTDIRMHSHLGPIAITPPSEISPYFLKRSFLKRRVGRLAFGRRPGLEKREEARSAPAPGHIPGRQFPAAAALVASLHIALAAPQPRPSDRPWNWTAASWGNYGGRLEPRAAAVTAGQGAAPLWPFMPAVGNSAPPR